MIRHGAPGPADPGGGVPDAIERRRPRLPALLYASVEEAAETNRRRIEQNVAFYHANPENVQARSTELEAEWDAERALQLSMAGASLAGFWLGMTRSRLWLLVPLAAAIGSLHHALSGTGPALDLARRMGFRTRQEIEAELAALARLQRQADE